MDKSHWEQCYQEGTTPWNKNRPSPPLAGWIQRQQPKGRALVPGCGVGHDLALLAEAGLEVTGLDISPTAVALARQAYPHLAERFVLGDLFALPEAWQGSFDLVAEHTCLCALPPEWRPRYEAAVYDALKPGGWLAGIWFIEPQMDPGESGPPFALPVEELDALFAAPRWEIVEDEVPADAFPGREGRERLRVLRKRM